MFQRRRKAAGSREGSALLGVLVVFVGIAGMVAASITLSTVEVEESRDAIDKVRARFVSEAGVEQAMGQLQDATRKASSLNPLEGIEGLFAVDNTITPFIGEPLQNGASQVGAYSVTMNLVSMTDTAATVEINSTGYLPAAPVPGGRPVDDWSTTSVRVRYELAPSAVFDYAYFVNNWGWLYGSTIYVYGNARSNAQFDSGGYAPTVTGTPTYDSLANSGGTVNLSGYRDDNGDGLEDGEDGGVWSGWDIVNTKNVKGNGGKASHQHDFQGSVEMPNLSDLTQYKDKAIAEGGQIRIGGLPQVMGVLGDDPGEKQHLYLHGTAANPIELDGPIVVQGDVMISGVVTGQGAIYAGGNVYVPDSVTYLDPPSTERPATNDQASTEKWIEDNWDKDFLGLFSAENIVVGDFTHNAWRHYIGGWMGSSMNKSKEDAGEDGVPNTKAGLDGILGTADDDVLEDDGVWTVEYYTAADIAMGLAPPGYVAGDPIPGSGEDIDGDGQQDGTTDLNSLNFQDSLNPGKWGGNMPLGGISKYRDVASMYASTIDAVLYTNHSFCYAVFGGTPARINGAMVCRNENIVYGTPSITTNYDSRLLGGTTGMAADLLPKTMREPQILRWTELDFDPNLVLVKP